MPRQPLQTRPNHLRVAERRAFVFRLRQAGATYLDILRTIRGSAEWMGRLPKAYNERHVHEDVKTELQRYRSDLAELADDVRQQELARLDRLFLAYWPRAIGEPAKQIAPDLQAARFVLDLMARRARYVPGVEAPIKVAPTNPAGTEEYQPTAQITDTYVAQVAALLAQYGELSTAQTNDPDAQDDEGLDTDGAPLPPYTNGATH